MGGLLILILILGAIYVLFMVPMKRRQRSHTAMQHTLEPGDQIITAGGLHGRVHEVGGDTLQVEVAPGVVVTLDRRAVAAVARDVEVEVEPDDADVEPGNEPEPS